MRAGSPCCALLAVALAACQRAPAHSDAGASASSVLADGAGPAARRASAENAAISAGLATLRREESALRARTDFATLPPSSRSLGSNPYALVAVAGTPLVAGILRGDSRLVLLDAQLREASELPTTPSPSALATAPGGHLFVAGPLAPSVERFRVEAGKLVPHGALALPDGSVPRALAADERALVVADFAGDRLYSLPEGAAFATGRLAPPPHVTATCQGPIRLALSAHYLAVACLFEHAVAVLARDARGEPGREVARIVHDGPLWSVALLELGDELFVAAGGVEDHPLERRDRVFGYIDSFAYLYALERDGRLVRRAAQDLGELGVAVPKALALVARDGAPVLALSGYATSALLELTGGGVLRRREGVPGCSALIVRGEGFLCADPLLDAWVELTPAGPLLHPVRPPTASDPSASERLGEALFFTTLMAPDASSDGRLSRFSCETCHFEGATDGRVHNSGRHEIRVSTRPLFGLFNDAPHFSRAHDPDLTSVCHNEFTVANRGNPVDPWFSLELARFPWLRALGVEAPRLGPLELRRALFAFLARFSDEENPFVVARGTTRRFSASERGGAEVFRARCERCHAARLVANDAATAVPFERWEALVLSDATPVVWARGEYERTGVLPYVNPAGTRIPSLRRLYLKRPYFTNGSARSLGELLSRARFDEHVFFHAEPPVAPTSAAPPPAAPPPAVPPSVAPAESQLRGLDASERSALLDFLRLL